MGGNRGSNFAPMRPPPPPQVTPLKPSLDPLLSSDAAGPLQEGGDKKGDLMNTLASPRNSSPTKNALPPRTESMLENFNKLVLRMGELMDVLARLVHPKSVNPYNQKLRDREVTSVFLRVRENVVISISPNTLSSVHRWLDAMGKETVVIASYWDSLKISLTKANFFCPKHFLEVLQLSLNVPPLRLELYSVLGENLCAGVLLKNLSLSLALEEQMAISGEGILQPDLRRGLTNLVKVRSEQKKKNCCASLFFSC